MNNWLVRLTSGFISLVNDNHMDNNSKEISVYMYLWSVVNNRLKKYVLSFAVQYTVDSRYLEFQGTL